MNKNEEKNFNERTEREGGGEGVEFKTEGNGNFNH